MFQSLGGRHCTECMTTQTPIVVSTMHLPHFCSDHNHCAYKCTSRDLGSNLEFWVLIIADKISKYVLSILTFCPCNILVLDTFSSSNPPHDIDWSDPSDAAKGGIPCGLSLSIHVLNWHDLNDEEMMFYVCLDL